MSDIQFLKEIKRELYFFLQEEFCISMGKADEYSEKFIQRIKKKIKEELKNILKYEDSETQKEI